MRLTSTLLLVGLVAVGAGVVAGEAAEGAASRYGKPVISLLTDSKDSPPWNAGMVLSEWFSNEMIVEVVEVPGAKLNLDQVAKGIAQMGFIKSNKCHNDEGDPVLRHVLLTGPVGLPPTSFCLVANRSWASANEEFYDRFSGMVFSNGDILR
jgi:hypothetical protein